MIIKLLLVFLCFNNQLNKDEKYYQQTTNENNDINLYDTFLNYSYSQLKELFKKAKTKEEQDFYMMLSNLVLQKEQAKVIGK